MKKETALKLEKILNTSVVLILGGLVLVGFMIMSKTAESNSITVDVAKYQSDKESRIVKEMRLMSLEMKNLQKDMEAIRDKIEKK